MRLHKRYYCGVIFFLAGLLFCFLSADPHATLAAGNRTNTLEIIKVGKRPAQELLPQVQTVLSSTGRASADTILNAIIVSDTPETVEKVRNLITGLDVPTPQVTITLRYRQAGTKNRTLSTTGGISSSEGGLRMGTENFNQQKTLQLMVGSGNSGYLMIGRDIPFTGYLLDLCTRYGYRFSWLNGYKRVESGFEVHPNVRGSRVDLTLLPRLSFDDRHEIRFTQAATRITIPVNTWVQVAASDAGTNSVSAAIITANGESNSRATVLEVMARVRD